MPNLTPYTRPSAGMNTIEAQVVMELVPKNLPFTQEEWGEMPKEERLIALQFFREESLASTRGLKFDFPRISFPTSGASYWEIATPEGDTKTAKELKGIVVYQLPSRVYYPVTEQPSAGTPPTCFSDDGKVPSNRAMVIQAETCGECPHSKWDTGKDGRGTACKERTRIFALLDNEGEIEEIPTMLSLPPTAVRPFADYVMKLIKAGYPGGLIGVITAFGLVDETNAGGQKFKKLACSVVRKLSYPEMRRMDTLRDRFRVKIMEMGESSTAEF